MANPLGQRRFWAASRKLTQLRLIAAGVVLCLGAVTATLRAASFTTSLDHDTSAPGESVTLSLNFEGGSPKGAPALPAIPNLQVVPAGQSSQFNLVNGQMSSTTTYNYSVTPRQAGEFTIPAFTIEVDGKKLSSKPLVLKVVRAAPPPDAAAAANQVAFLQLVLPKKEVYVGEVMVAELRIYLRDVVQNIRQFNKAAFPMEGFNEGKNVEGQHRPVQIGNANFSVIPLYIPLTAVKAGAQTIGPVDCNAALELPPSGQRRRDAFDPFGMFQQNEIRQVALSAEAQKIEVLPLPAENLPPNFSGAVGNYTMTVTAGPTTVATGDPITVRVQIAGHGALEALTLPEQTAWHDFKTYPPTSKVETSDTLGLQGAKTFEQIVTPQNTDIQELPPFSFSFFDPDQKKYRTLTQPAVKLVVHPGGAAPAPVIAATKSSAADNPPPAQDIVHIKPRLGAVAQIAPPLAQQPWFLALQSGPVLAWAAALGWRKRKDTLANNPRLRRQRQVARLIREGLADLRRLAAENKSENFFATLFRLLQEQLGERLDCPASAITEAVIEERLRPGGVPEPALTALRELFQTCNLARYAPVKTSQELAALIPKLEDTLRELQNLKA